MDRPSTTSARQLTIVVDADSIIAQVNPKDLNHHRTLSIAHNLNNLNARIIYPQTVIIEAVTYIQRVLGSRTTAYSTAVLFTNPDFEVLEITRDIYSRAVNQYFSPKTSKKNTLFDGIVAAVAEENQADAVFSFDKFYKTKGFKLASEL